MGQTVQDVALSALITDERLRGGFDYWCSKATGGRLPRRADIDPAEIPHLLPHINTRHIFGSDMSNFPRHGPLSCKKCFRGTSGNVIEVNGWRLVNDPGLWGASDPLVLILGQSKGNTQMRVNQADEFDRVAFEGMRDWLAKVLARIGVPIDAANVDRHFTSAETDLAFASLLRCSLSDPSGKTSGSPVMYAMDDAGAGGWIHECMRTWLLRPSPRLRLVVALGLSPGYVKRVLERLRGICPATFRKLNSVVAECSGDTWVFAQHPSRISENHYRRWIGSESHPKRDTAQAAVKRVLRAY